MDDLFYQENITYDEMFEKINRVETLPPDKHLDSPITISLLLRITSCLSECAPIVDNKRPVYSGLTIGTFEKWVNANNLRGASGFKYIMKPLLNFLVTYLGPLRIVYPNEYPELFSRTYSGPVNIMADFEIACSLFKQEETTYLDWLRPLCSDQSRKFESSSYKLTKDAFEHYCRFKYWDKVVESYRICKSKNITGKESELKIKLTHFYFFNGFAIEERDNPNAFKKPILYLYSYEQLMMLQDACLARFNTFLAIGIKFHNGNSDLEGLVKDLLKWQEECLVKYGNLGYDILKGPESVFKTYLTKLSQGDILGYSSFDRTIDKLSEKEKKISKGSDPMTKKLYKLATSVVDIGNTVELFGLVKLSGHPFVSAEVSAASVKEEAQFRGNICPIAMTTYPLYLKRMILVTYISKHGCWPPFKNPPKDNTKTHKFWKSNYISVKTTDIPIQDLEDLRFGKWMDFDYSPEYLDFIDDKAISPGINECSKFWFGGNSSSPRRLLEKLIYTPDIDTRKIVDRMSQGKFFENELIVELTQKEREFKIAARCFAKMVFEVRLFFVLTEANLKNFMGGATGVDGYMPQQTMTMSESATKKRLYDLTKDTKLRESICLEVDFSRWNLRWRKETVNPCARIIEDIFGFKGVFSQTHDFFNKCTILLTDKHTIPDTAIKGTSVNSWKEGNLVWRNHLGGFEGISQSMWTICTIAMMYWALEGLNVSFLMAGQGDNQIFTLTFPKNLDMKDQLTTLLVQIDMRCNRLNHDVKPDECIDSASVMTYSKEIYLNGVHKQYVLKYASRAFAKQDLTTPSLIKEIAGVNANAMACASSSHSILPVFFWKFIQTILVIRHRSESPLYRQESPLLLKLLKHSEVFLIPTSIGGLPMIPWNRFLIRGESDPLGWDLAGLLRLSKKNKNVRQYLICLSAGQFNEKNPDNRILLSDPHAIPIRKISDDSQIMAREIESILPSKNKNKDLAPLLNFQSKSSGEEFKKWVLSMKPFAPEIASDLYQLTPAGLREKILKRFSMTRTIGKFTSSTKFINHINRNTVCFLKELISRWSSIKYVTGVIPTSSYEFAKLLRKNWTIEVENSNIGSYNPFDFELSPSSFNTSIISADITSDISSILTEVGKAPPNFGTNTKTKVSKHGYAIANTGSSIRDLKRAILIASEMGNTPDIISLVNSIVMARSNWDTEALLGVFPTAYGGTGIHRHNSLGKKPFGLMGSSTVPTHITFSTDLAGILSGGEDDYPLIFQEFFLTLTHIAQSCCSLKITIPTSYGFIVPSVLDPIPPLTVSTTTKTPRIKWPNLQNNKLAFVSSLSFFEIPSIPCSPLVRKVDVLSNQISQDSRLLNYLWHESRLSTYTQLPETAVPLSYDLIDMKEFSRIDPDTTENMFLLFSLMKASERVLNMTQNSIINQEIANKNFLLVLKRYMLFFSTAMVRQMLHPKFKNSDYAIRNLITLNPGECSHMVASRRLYLNWTKKMQSYLASPSSFLFPAILLTAEWKPTIHRFLASYVFSIYFFFEEERSILKIAKKSKLLTSNLSNCAENIDFLLCKIHNGVKDYHVKNHRISSPLEIFYINCSSKESLRAVRSKEICVNFKGKSQDEANFPKVTIHNKGLCSWTTDHQYGVLSPDFTPSCSPDKKELFITHFRRRVGISASIVSDWIAYVQANLDLFKDLHKIALFGVGRGATAKVMQMLKKDVVGFDLRKTHPILPHRSSSYIPPELLNNSKGFTWSRCYMQTNGDLLTNNWNLEQEGVDSIVIDLDLSSDILLRIIEKVPLKMRVFLRCRLTLDQFKFFCDSLNPDKVTCIYQDRQSNIGNYIITFIAKNSKIEGNYKNIKNYKINQLEYTLDSNKNDQFQTLLDSFSSTFIKYNLRHPSNIVEFKSIITKHFLTNQTESKWRDIFVSNKINLDTLKNSDVKILGKLFSLCSDTSTTKTSDIVKEFCSFLKPN